MKNSLYLVLLILFSCTAETPEGEEIIKHGPPLKIISPGSQDQFFVGETIDIEIEITDASKVLNLELYFADTLYKTGLKSESQKLTVSTANGKVGDHKIFFSYEDENGERHGDTRNVVIFSDLTPKQKKAVSVNVFPHDKSSYTQGLEFYNGKLFEGTGRNGTSILGEVDLMTGKIIRKTDLESRYFGEGITILNDTIYQITWSEKTCLVYDMNFTKIKEFNYEGEGWGLCNDGTYLIMSNGSNEIVWRDRTTFEIVKRIQVFSDQQDRAALNELELINGNLFINVYTEDLIIEVDTATGKILSEIDCSTIVKDGMVAGADVLNGIAYNAVNGKTYITGKWWPKLYEVKFEE